MSNVQDVIVASNIGYRNPFLFDGNDHTAFNAYQFDTIELKNTDISEFVATHHHQTITSPQSFENWLYSLKQFSANAELFLYWFTTRDNVIKLYSGDESLVEYQLPENYIVISDLGPDGIGIVSDTPLSALTQSTLN